MISLLMIGLLATGVIVWFLGAVVGITWFSSQAVPEGCHTMNSIPLSDRSYRRLLSEAKRRGCSIEKLIVEMLEREERKVN